MEKVASLVLNEREALAISDFILVGLAIVSGDAKLIVESSRLLADGTINNCYSSIEFESLRNKVLKLADIFDPPKSN